MCTAESCLAHREMPLTFDPTNTPGHDLDGDDDSAAAKINLLDPAPPRTLTDADVRVYTALVANDQPDSYFTQFTPNALAQVARGILGMPVLRNHSSYGSGDLPVGRWFAADCIQRDGVNWARCQFYTAAAGDPEADMLDARIQAGIIREVSLSWWQGAMKCSICGQDMWGGECPHIPGESYDGRTCIGIMDSIREVAEASLVWKGGQYGTQIDTAARTEGSQRITLVQRIAAKRSARPASAGETELERYLGDAIVPVTLEQWLTAG